MEQFDSAQNEYIDLPAALGRVRGNKKLYRRMLDMFLSSTEFDVLEQCLSQGDLEGAVAPAHAIKGIAGNLSFIKLFDTSTALLESLRNNSYSDALAQTYRQALQQTQVAVKALAQDLDAQLS